MADDPHTSGDEPSLGGTPPESNDVGLGGANAVLHWLEMLNHADVRVRRKAAFALTQHGHDQGVAELFQELQNSTNYPMTRRILKALAQHPSDLAVQGLLMGFASEIPSVRNEAIHHLAKRGEDPRILPTLVAALDHENYDIRLYAAQGVIRSGQDGLINRIIGMLDSAQEQDQTIAISALGLLKRPDVMQRLMAIARDDAPNWLSQLAVTSLGAQQADEAVALLIDLQNEPTYNRVFRASVITALAQIADPRGLDALVTFMSTAAQRRDAMIAAEGLARIGTDRAVEELGWMLDDRELMPFIRMEALRNLAKSGNPAAIDWLVKTLDDPDPHFQAWAAIELANLQAVQAVDALLELLNRHGDSPEHGVISDVIHALGRFPDQRVVAALARWLGHPLHTKDVIYSLKRIGTAEALAAVEAYQSNA